MSIKVLMFGCSSNPKKATLSGRRQQGCLALFKRFDPKHSSGISALLQSRDVLKAVPARKVRE